MVLYRIWLYRRGFINRRNNLAYKRIIVHNFYNMLIAILLIILGVIFNIAAVIRATSKSNRIDGMFTFYLQDSFKLDDISICLIIIGISLIVIGTILL